MRGRPISADRPSVSQPPELARPSMHRIGAYRAAAVLRQARHPSSAACPPAVRPRFGPNRPSAKRMQDTGRPIPVSKRSDSSPGDTTLLWPSRCAIKAEMRSGWSMIRKSGNRVFPREKREAFARRSCSNKKIADEHDSSQLKHAPGFRNQFPQHRIASLRSRPLHVSRAIRSRRISRVRRRSQACQP